MTTPTREQNDPICDAPALGPGSTMRRCGHPSSRHVEEPAVVTGEVCEECIKEMNDMTQLTRAETESSLTVVENAIRNGIPLEALDIENVRDLATTAQKLWTVVDATREYVDGALAREISVGEAYRLDPLVAALRELDGS